MKIDNILLDKLTAQAKESLRLRSIMKDLLSDIRREDFPDVARKLMNHYCVLKKDSRYDGDLIFSICGDCGAGPKFICSVSLCEQVII